MSRDKPYFPDNKGFISRFIEVCGTDKPSEIQQLLDVSNQAVRNYLTGRVPDTCTLLRIADVTPFSIHWLLTGRGKKIAEMPEFDDTLLSIRQFDELVKKVTVEVVNEIGGRRKPPQPTIAPPPSDDMYSDEATGELAELPKRNQQDGRLGSTAESTDD